MRSEIAITRCSEKLDLVGDMTFTDLVQDPLCIDAVHPYSAPPEGALFIEYTHIVTSPVHIARLIGDKPGFV